MRFAYYIEERNISDKVQGNTEGLKASQLKALSRLYKRRYPAKGGYTIEQARELAILSFTLGRQVALLIDRQGRPYMVIVGDAKGIFIPELPRSREGTGRLRGLRLLRTHISGELLSEEDLTDLLFLRLDSVSVLSIAPEGEPDRLLVVHLMPSGQDNRRYDITEPLPWDKVDIDFIARAKALDDELEREGLKIDQENLAERAILVEVSNPNTQAFKDNRFEETAMAELSDLARTAGLNVVRTVIQHVSKVNPKFIMGKGKLAELEIMALADNAGTLVFDGELSSAQMRNLAEITERKILDRTLLILDIFAQNAKTASGRLQVEMAQLKYTLPRLAGQGRAMSRLMGGIGGRGPGETKLEMDRRRIRERISKIKKKLDSLRRRRSDVRERRAKANIPVVALVGYTNAGKSTLINVLTGSEMLAENKLFSTLDPVSRRLRFPSEKEIILTDTVGFIRDLPIELREAFLATLEEIETAQLLVHVADASHPELERQLKSVEKTLGEMNLGDRSVILTLNKWDLVDRARREELKKDYPDAFYISGLNQEGLVALAQAMVKAINVPVRNYRPKSPCAEK